jgi:hypothetical protein
MSVPVIWRNLIARDLSAMQATLIADKSQANARHPGSNQLPLDAAIYWGYLPETRMLVENGAKFDKSPLGSAVMLGNLELMQWVYDNLDKNVNDSAIVEAVFASTRHNDEHKYASFRFMVDKGSDPNLYRFNAITLSPLTTKYLVENGFLNDLSVKANNGRTFLDWIELRKLPHPHTMYMLPDRSNEIYVAITNSDLNSLIAINTNINLPLSDHVGTPYHYALSIGAYIAAVMLVQKGANTEYTTPSGENAIGSALRSNSLDCVNLARDGLPAAAINAVYTNKRNMQVAILQQAISRCVSTSVFTSLLQPRNGKHGADPNLLCAGVPPAGHIAYVIRAPDHPFTHHVELFKALVDAGARVDEYNGVMRNSARGFYLSILNNRNFGNFTADMISVVSSYKK